MTTLLPSEFCRLVSSSPQETARLGAILGRLLTAGCVVCLIGELGTGKTCLAQGIAAGLEVPQDVYVTSPSFAVVNEYPGRLVLFHVDLYRLEDPAELDGIGFEDILCGDGVVVIEWADKFVEALPKERLEIRLAFLDDEHRAVTLVACGRKADTLLERCRKAIHESANNPSAPRVRIEYD